MNIDDIFQVALSENLDEFTKAPQDQDYDRHVMEAMKAAFKEGFKRNEKCFLNIVPLHFAASVAFDFLSKDEKLQKMALSWYEGIFLMAGVPLEFIPRPIPEKIVKGENQ